MSYLLQVHKGCHKLQDDSILSRQFDRKNSISSRMRFVKGILAKSVISSNISLATFSEIPMDTTWNISSLLPYTKFFRSFSITSSFFLDIALLTISARQDYSLLVSKYLNNLFLIYDTTVGCSKYMFKFLTFICNCLRI